jgi:hypothetical protein
LTLDDAHEIVEQLDANNVNSTIYYGYQGRGMDNATTGVVTRNADDAIDAMTQRGIIWSFRQDAMGLDTIIY